MRFLPKAGLALRLKEPLLRLVGAVGAVGVRAWTYIEGEAWLEGEEEP